MKPVETINFVDTSMARIYVTGDYDLTLPSGQHIRNQCADTTAAKAEAITVHDNYVKARWLHGKHEQTRSGQNVFIVPLS